MQVVGCELHNWLGLYHTPGMGAAKFKALLEKDPSLDSVVHELDTDWHGVERDLAWLENNANVQILTWMHPQYPTMLKHISGAPPVLYVKGNLDCLAAPQLAIVGSRNPSQVGLQQAQYFAKSFAELGLTVTSGLAQGIDTAGHIGALAASFGKTIAVLGHGLDMIYPPANARLAEQLAENGCLVSEFPIGVQPLANHFPRRNRIISGLSLGVLVVEAALNSGSLITAKCALDQGREVFAIPGSIHSQKVKGCHQLIRQGAKLVEAPQDVLEELTSLLNYVIRDKKASDRPLELAKGDLSAQHLLLLRIIGYEITSVDSMVARSGLEVCDITAMLLDLELKGFIAVVPGGYIRKLG